MESLLADYGSSSDAGTDTDSSDLGRDEAKQRSRRRRAANKKRAWLGEAEMDDEPRGGRRDGPGNGQKKKAQPPQFVSGGGTAVSESSLSPSPSPSPAPASESPAPERKGGIGFSMFAKPSVLEMKNDDSGSRASQTPPPAAKEPAADASLPPKTKSKYSISFASPKKEEKAPERTVTNADRERSVGFLGDITSGTSKKLFNMMKKAGWTPGKGMGKNEQGHSEAVDVKLRPKMAGVGMIDEKTDQQKRRERRDRGESEPEEESMAALAAMSSGSPTADMFGGATVGEDGQVSLTELSHVKLEVKAAGKSSAWKKRERKALELSIGQGFGEGSSVIVDYRKSVTPPPDDDGMFAIVEDTTGSAFLADLTASIARALDEASAQARDIDSRLTQEEARKAAFAERIEEGVKRREEQARSEGNLDIVVSFIDRLKTKIEEGMAQGNTQVNPTTLARALMQKVVGKDAEYHGTYTLLSEQIAGLMITTVLPLFQQLFKEWSPQAGRAGVDELAAWQSLLKANLPLYHRLAWDMVGPRLQGFIATGWDVYRPNQLLGAFDAYMPFLSVRARDHLVHNGVIPRLLQGVARYEEQAGALRLHDFIVPWVKYTVTDDGYPVNALEERGVLPAVRDKLIKLLSVVDLAEAYDSLVPWRSVLHPKQYNTLRDRYGTGRCGDYLAKLVIDPRRGSTAADKAFQRVARNIAGIARWAADDARTTSAFLTALANDLAPRLTYVLAVFARAERTNLPVAFAYYKTWKQLLVDALTALPDAVRATALRTLHIPASMLVAASRWWVGRGAQGGDVEMAEGEPVTADEDEGAHLFDVGAVNQHAFGKLKLSRLAAQLHLPAGHHVPHATVTQEGNVLEEDELTLREQVEALAGEENLPFCPRPDHHRVDGNRVYALGEISVYFHANCLFYQHQGEWVPAPSIAQLVDTASRQHAKRVKRDAAPPKTHDSAPPPPPVPSMPEASATMELD